MKKVFILCLSVTIFLFSNKTNGQGNLLVYPKRLVFEGATRSAQVSLSNTGVDSARYVLSLVQIRMKEDGSFEPIEKPDSGQLFADKYVRFYPKEVILAPNEAQTVKIQLIKTSEMTEGEFRSHLYFRSEERVAVAGQVKDGSNKELGIKLKPVFGISIPLIIRKGSISASVDIADSHFVADSGRDPMLQVQFARQGNSSVYGDIIVDYYSAAGKKQTVGMLKGVAIYSPTKGRKFSIPLQKDIPYYTGKLKLSYIDRTKNKMLFESGEIRVNNPVVAK